MNEALPSEKDYVQAVEAGFQRLRARPLVLSPEDLRRVLDWYGRGVPLSLVLETMESVHRQAASRGAHRAPRSLAYCEPAIEEAFEGLLEGRVGAARSDAAGSDPELPRLLEEAAAAVRASEAPAALRDDVAGKLEFLARDPAAAPAGDDLPAELERRLVAGCLASLDAAEGRALEERAGAEIAPLAAGMREDVRRRALDRARARLVRERFRLPDLSLLPLLS